LNKYPALRGRRRTALQVILNACMWIASALVSISAIGEVIR
jgi:hypothetical protein